MNQTRLFMSLLLLLALLAGCARTDPGGTADAIEADAVTGPHGGRLLEEGPVSVELAIFETGVPPEFRAWVRRDGRPVPPRSADLRVELRRLGGAVDHIDFAPVGDFLRGTTTVHEPHSFEVEVTGRVAGGTHTWQYATYEGRTTIAAEAAQAAAITTSIAGPGRMTESLRLYGTLVPDGTRVREVRARFPGLLQSVAVRMGDRVRSGQVLASVEANDSLQTYAVTAPGAGVITRRDAEPGTQTHDDPLFEVADYSMLWAEFSLFARDRPRVHRGQAVLVSGGDVSTTATIDYVAPSGDRASQSVIARVVIDNQQERWLPGQFIEGIVTLAERDVPLVVATSALQTFRDFEVVYAQVGDTYEVRMLELGQRDGQWAEVLSGLDPGTAYVTGNSYLIKADIEKSGATHDH